MYYFNGFNISLNRTYIPKKGVVNVMEDRQRTRRPIPNRKLEVTEPANGEVYIRAMTEEEHKRFENVAPVDEGRKNFKRRAVLW